MLYWGLQPQEVNRTGMDKLKPVNYSNLAVAELIDKTTWANDFSWDEIKTLGGYFTAYEVEKGTVIFYEGARADYMGLIVRGRVRISKTGADHSVIPLITLTESQTFGEQSLIDGEPRSGLAETLEPTVFVITKRQQLFRMAKEEPDLAFRVLWKVSHLLSQRLRHTSFKLVDAPGSKL
jgi:CRP-like cAMP-binding protein